MEGREGGGTATGQHRRIRGNKTGLVPELDENNYRLRADQGDRGIRAVNVTVSQQSNGALVAWIGRVRVNHAMQPGKSHHGLKHQKDTEPQGRMAPPRLP